jgi:hypothetical protein
MCRTGYSHELLSTIGISFLATDLLPPLSVFRICRLDTPHRSCYKQRLDWVLKKNVSPENNLLTVRDVFCIFPIPVDDLVFENRIAVYVEIDCGFYQ